MPQGPIAARLVLALAAAGILTACTRPVYELRGGLLYPPQRPAQERPSRTVLQLLPDSKCAALHGGMSNPSLGLEWTLTHRRLAITLWPSIASFGERMPVPLLDGIQALHRQMDLAVASGCLAPMRERDALQRAAESLPMTPQAAQEFVLGPYAVQKFIDVDDPVELQMTYALEPSAPERYDLGYAVLTYQLKPATSDGRGRLELVSSEVLDTPKVKRPPLPPIAIVARVDQDYRLFFYLRRSASDHDVALLEADSRGALDKATQALLARPNSCAHLLADGAHCIVMPPDVGLDARLTVQVQGRATTVALSDTVESALEESGVRDPGSVLATLQVMRPYRSGYAQVEVTGPKNALLRVTLSGGERIRW